MGGPATVTWKGHRFDPRTRDMLIELERVTGLDLTPTQGSYNTSVKASGGTHAGGGAFDLSVKGLSSAQIDTVVFWARRIGNAAWHRKAIKGLWGEHIHGIAIGCPDLSSAAANQVAAYRQHRNGLADWGPDDGPNVPYTTWEKYKKGADDLSAEAERQIAEIHDITVDKGYIDTTLSAGFKSILDKLEFMQLGIVQTAEGGLRTRGMLAAQLAANATALKALQDGQTDIGEIEKACERAAEKAVRKVLGSVDEGRS